MKKYEVLEHTADLKIRVFGKDKKELFRNALLGMQKALRPRIREKRTETTIEIKSEKLDLLLVDFLSEINYLNEVNQEIYQSIRFRELTNSKIQADLFGKKVQRFGMQIKGVTFHDLNVHQKEDKSWEATILFDV